MKRQAVLVAKGGFYQQTGGNWIFKVSDERKTAYKVIFNWAVKILIIMKC